MRHPFNAAIVALALTLASPTFAQQTTDAQVSLQRGIQSYEVGQDKQAKTYLYQTISQNPQAFEAYYWLGQVAMRGKNVEEAKKQFQSALNINSDHLPSLERLGLIYAQQGDLAKAQPMLSKAAKNDTKDAKVYAYLGAYQLNQQNKVSAAEEYFQKATRLDPRNEMARAGLITVDIRKGISPKEMSYALENMKSDFPRNVPMRILLAQSYNLNDDPNAAIGEYSSILKMDPKNGQAWLEVGQVLSSSNRDKQALEALERSIRYNYNPHLGYYEKGVIAYRQANYAKAVSALESSLSKKSDFVPSLMLLGKTQRQTKQYDAAKATLTKALQIPEGQTAQVYAALGDVAFVQKDYEQAKSYYNKAIRMDKKDAYGRYGYARALEATDQDKKAVTEYQRVIRLGGPASAMAKERLGYIYLKEQKYSKAFDVFQEATTANPQDLQLWNAFGESAYGIRDYTTALDAFNRSIAFKTNYFPAYANRARTYRAMKQYERAIEAYQEALKLRPTSVSDWEALVAVSAQADQYRVQVEALQQLEKLEPKKVAHSNRLGALFLKKNSMIQATSAYERSLEKDPTDLQALEAMANLTYEAKEYSKSKAYYQRLVRQKPEHALGLARLGEISYLQKDYSAASAYFARAMKVDGNNGVLPYRYAQAQEKNGNSPKALISLYQNAFDADNTNVSAGLKVAQLKDQTGDKKGAIDQYKKVLAKSPQSQEAMEEKGMLLLQSQKYPEAAATFEQLHLLGAPTAKTSEAQAKAYRLMQEYEKAQNAYERALTLNPGDEEILYELALVQMELGKDREAKDSLKKIVLQNPNAVLAQEKLGDLHMKEQNYREAVERYAQVTRLKPSYALGFQKLGIAYAKSGQSKMALSPLKRSVDIDSKAHASYWYLATIEKDRALSHYQKAAALMPDNLTYQMDYGDALFKAKQYPQAVQVYSKAQELDGQNVDVLMSLAAALAANQQYAQATQTYARVNRIDDKNFQAWVGRARAYRSLGDDRKAAESFEEAFKINPKDVQVAQERALAYEASGQTAKAIMAFEQVLDLKADHFEALAHVGALYYKEQKFALAQQRLERAVNINSRHVPSQVLLGDIYFQNKSYQESFQAYQVVQDQAPKESISYLRMGMIYNIWGELDFAEQQLKKTISLDAKQPIAYYELGTVYEKQKRNNQALTAYETATNLKDDYAQAWFRKANLFSTKTQKQRKEKAYLKAISINEQYTEARVALAELYANIDYQSKAIEQYRSILKYSPGERDIRIDLAELELAVDKPSMAIADLKDYAKAHPQDSQIQYLLGRAYYEDQSYRDARRHLESAISADSNDAKAHTYMGLSQIKEKKYSKSKRYFEKAMDLRSDDALNYYGLGQVAVQEKNYEQAIAYSKKAVSLDPTLTDAYFHMGVAYKALGKEDEADKAFAKTVPVNSLDGVGKTIDINKAFQNYNR